MNRRHFLMAALAGALARPTVRTSRSLRYSECVPVYDGYDAQQWGREMLKYRHEGKTAVFARLYGAHQ